EVIGHGRLAQTLRVDGRIAHPGEVLLGGDHALDPLGAGLDLAAQLRVVQAGLGERIGLAGDGLHGGQRIGLGVQGGQGGGDVGGAHVYLLYSVLQYVNTLTRGYDSPAAESTAARARDVTYPRCGEEQKKASPRIVGEAFSAEGGGIEPLRLPAPTVFETACAPLRGTFQVRVHSE